MKTKIQASLVEHLETMQRVQGELASGIADCAELMLRVLRRGGKLLVMGNGGSAADAQHFAAELVGRFERERRGLPAIALTTDSSNLTALGNDYGFAHIFRRQVEALATPDDLVLGISTSGHSENVLLALQQAKEIGCPTVGLLGKDGGSIASQVELALVVPGQRTARIQEAHLTILHILCELIDEAVTSNE